MFKKIYLKKSNAHHKKVRNLMQKSVMQVGTIFSVFPFGMLIKFNGATTKIGQKKE